MRPWSSERAGRLEELEIESEALADDPLGDPSVPCGSTRPPPDTRTTRSDGTPTVCVIQGLTGQLDMWCNREAFRPTYLESADESLRPR